AEPEELVLEDKAPNGRSILLFRKGSFWAHSGSLKEIARLERVRAIEEVNVAMIAISARLGHRVDHGSAGAPEFRPVGAGLSLEFLQSVYLRRDDKRAIVVGVIVYAVQNKVVEPAPGAVATEADVAWAAAGGVSTPGALPLPSHALQNHARAKGGKMEVRTAV